ncbi:DUF6151 family protein [Sedimentitalea sp. HM32M-2]|uniref:DUF6151 family protein n=1 Tax=Sedimentitalea sp. HM32M-2 TaxID=3351566 RepID=UPI003626B320
MADPATIGFACECGQIRGHISPAGPRAGTHLICHCRDCRAAELYLNQPDPGPEGVDLYQTTPDTVHVDSGAEHLAVLRLGPKGPLRWYAGCCKVPLFNTLARPGLPFAAVRVARLDDAAKLGPIQAHCFIPQPGGASKHRGAGRLAWNLLTRMGAARLSGRWRQTPFFDAASGAPVAPIHLLSKEERAKLY